MKLNKIFFLIYFLVVSINTLFSQSHTDISEISQEEQNKLKKLAVEEIKNLGYFLKELAETNDKAVKERFIQAIIGKFVDDAKIQTGIDKNGKLKITSPGGGYTVEYYLRKIIPKYKSTLFSIVHIELVSFDIGELKPLPGVRGTYYFDYSFIQIFKKGSRNTNGKSDIDTSFQYIDKTKKSGRVIVSKKNTILGTKWVLFFDSIIVDDVKKIS